MVRVGFRAGGQKLEFVLLMTCPENMFHVTDFLIPPVKVTSAPCSQKAPGGVSKALYGQERKLLASLVMKLRTRL